jgi:hypothetical protein
MALQILFDTLTGIDAGSSFASKASLLRWSSFSVTMVLKLTLSKCR